MILNGIILNLKGIILNLLQSPHYAMNYLQHTHSSGQDATICKSHSTHWALITSNMSCGLWYKGTVQPLSLTELKSHTSSLYFIGRNNYPMKEGRKPEYPKEIPMTSFRKCHTLKPKNSNSNQDSNPHSSTYRRRLLGKQV